MKYLQKYRLFESDEDDIHPDDAIKPGHKMSWNDIKERMVYLNDVGFNLDEEHKSQYFIDDDGNKVNLTQADKLVTEIKMVKNLSEDDDIVSRRKDGAHIYFQKWNDGQLEILEAIASFCAHFEECYYSFNHVFDKLMVDFIIYHDVDPQVREREREEDNTRRVREKIITDFESARKYFIESNIKVTKDKITKNKLGESMWGLQGSIEGGFIVVPVNLDNCSPFAKRTVTTKLNNNIDSFERASGRTGKVELRKITNDDIKNLVKFANDPDYDEKYFSERYLGLMAYIITFDYKKLFDKRKSGFNI